MLSKQVLLRLGLASLLCLTANSCAIIHEEINSCRPSVEPVGLNWPMTSSTGLILHINCKLWE